MSTKISATKNIKSSKTRKTTNKNDKYISPKNYI